MSAGTVVIAGGILAAVILLTIVAVLCLCRLQYYCCKREESEKGEEEEPELSTMSPSHPLALSAPPTPPTPERYSDETETYPPTFLTEANGPGSYSPPPPPPPLRRCHRSHAFCPSCARCTLPFYLQHPERLCNGGRRAGYRSVHQDPEGPSDLAGFYHKLDLIRSAAARETVTRSVSTDV
uniref:protein FAM163B n=1 Tax=Doryrhamphus excisus TaxID=161450 RepID=UPI0025ADC17F|nr:protein FAM163B [Doryrhamphus excisus]XP_057927531.1 protein FAM163B [Doryrhamphus excisus]XP_057927532.1 protein FAM163B [Doryrhamphus excisus]XP_057927533.1 protein FAM163B [Doryrhamphus excisus]